MAEVPVQPQPTTSKGINWKNILIGAVIGVVIVGIIGALVFYLYQSNSDDTTPTQVTTPKTATDSAKQATPSAKKDETADWKTYTDNILKFSIKYPDQIVLISSQEGSQVTFIRKEDEDKVKKGGPLSIAIVPNLSIRSRGTGGDPEEVFTNSECGKPCDEDIEEITLNNATGIKTLGPRYPYEFNYYLTDSDQSGNVMRLNLVPWDKNPEFKSDEQMTLLKKMVSTFRFHR